MPVIQITMTANQPLVIHSKLENPLSRKQNIVALSTIESETIGLTYAAQEAIWFKELLDELGFPQNVIEIFEDNQAGIKLAKNPQQHSTTAELDAFN